MRLDWALLANAAEGPPNGLVYVLGAGIDTLWREQFPAPFGGAMVLRLLTSRLESERAHKVEVHCSDQDGNAVLPQPIVLTLPPRQVPSEHPQGWDLAANIVINLAGVHFVKPGFYQFEILIDDQQVRTLPFRLVQPPGGTASAPA
ncbi:MAG TPA: hypothetical protein VGU71_19450 [Candidatus Dormibacteraeota bacterium]|nr:hypothetical protein [Candidatus Dormibacteraeota bacterium]